MELRKENYEVIKKEMKQFENANSFSLILRLLGLGYSVSLNKLKVIDYIIKNPNYSLNKVSKDLKIDYKNVWRIAQEMQEAGIVQFHDTSQGKKGKAEVKREFTIVVQGLKK